MSHPRHFGSPRPPGAHPHPIRASHPRGHERFFASPTPSGAPPFRISLADVLGTAKTDAITRAGRLVFHMVGDTGGVRTRFIRRKRALLRQ